MIFESITIQNFMSIKSVKLELKDRGLMLLNGVNKDNPSLNNNGAGKSSILEAIIYALYGRTLRGLRGDAVVNRATGKNTKVFLDLTDDDGTPYRIARYRKHSANKSRVFLYKNGVDITPKSEMDLEEYITELLQADYTTFTSSLLYSAESFKFTTATDAEIKKTFDTMLGLDRLTQCKEIAHRGLVRVNSRLDALEHSKDSRQNDIQQLEDQIAEQTDEMNKWDAEHESKVQKAVDQKAKLEQKGHDLQAELKELTEEYTSLDSDISELEGAVDQKKEQLHQADELKEELADVSAHIKETELSIKGCTFAIKNNDEYVVSRRKEVDAIDQRIQELESKIQQTQSQVGQPCPTCGKPLDEGSIASAVQEIQDQIAQQQRCARGILDDIEGKLEQTANLRKQRDEYNSMLVLLYVNRNQLNDKLSKSAVVEESKDKLEKQLTRATKLQHDLELKITSKRSEIKANTQQIQQLTSQLETLRAETNPLVSIVQRLKDRVAEYQAEVSELDDEMVAVQAKRECLEFWDKAYSNQGIKSFILDDITPFLNRRVNKYLTKLTSGQIEVVFSTQTALKSGERREKFSIDVTNRSGGDGYPSNSGGEKKRIDLAINLALQDLVASRSSKKINIAIFDEVFDALDENGIDGVISLLQELAGSKSTILVVSHNEYLKSYFTNVLTVVKQGGYSTLQMDMEPIDA